MSLGRLFRKHVKHFNSEVFSLDLRQNILILFIATFLFSGFVTVNGILHLFYFHDVCFDESSKARDFIWVLILIGISQVLHQTSDWSLFILYYLSIMMVIIHCFPCAFSAFEVSLSNTLLQQTVFLWLSLPQLPSVESFGLTETWIFRKRYSMCDCEPPDYRFLQDWQMISDKGQGMLH